MTRRWNGFEAWQNSVAALALAMGLAALPAWASKSEPKDAKKVSVQAKVVPLASRSKAKPTDPPALPALARKAEKATVRKARTVRDRTAGDSKPAAGNRRSLRQAAAMAAPAVMSVGVLAGLHAANDPLDLKSAVALVIDRDSQEVLVSKNPQAVLPIASITKLMTALVVVEAGQAMDEVIHIEAVDADETMNRRSRLKAGTSLSRGEMLRLALMASENRAAHALSRHFPGGADAFVQAMNSKARALGMKDTRFVEATGLSADNRSSAMDLTRLITAASSHAVIRDFSTSHESVVPVGARDQATQFRSTNGLIGNPEWDISLQKTGYIAAAGRCLVMQASLAGRRLTMVLLDSAGKYSRFADAERIRQWLLRDGQVLSSAVSLPKPETVH